MSEKGGARGTGRREDRKPGRRSCDTRRRDIRPQESVLNEEHLDVRIARAQDSASPAAELPNLPGVGRGAQRHRVRELRFVKRIHRLRTLGLGLGALCVASVLRLGDAAAPWWVLL